MSTVSTRHYALERRFADERERLIEELHSTLRERLEGGGIGVVVYHRKRLEVEISLLLPDNIHEFSLRDIRPDEFDSFAGQPLSNTNPLSSSITSAIGYAPAEGKGFPIETTEGIFTLVYLFAAESLTRLSEYVEPSLSMIKLQLQLAILKDSYRRNVLELELLQETGAILSMSINLEDMLRSISAALQKLIPYDALGIFILGHNAETVDELFSLGYDDARSNELLKMKAGKGLVGWATKTGEPVIVPNVLEDSRYVAARERTRSELVIPLFSGNQVIGAFNLESDRTDAFTPSDLEMVTAFANQAALSITRAQLIQRTLDQSRIREQLEVAREIQKSFLPRKFPQYPGFDFDAVNVSSEAVGGDYFDFIPIVDNQLGITIADVSGKGLPASLIMASFRASLIAEIRNNYAIRTILRKVNNLICESVERGKFVTAVYGVLDIKNKTLTFSNAGHNPPFILRANGKVEFLADGGMDSRNNARSGI